MFNVDPPPSTLLIPLRRMHYEAHAMFIADLKNKVSATDEDLPRKIPDKDQQARLTGIRIEGEHECSHALLDLVMQQHEKNEVKHVPLTQCTSRDQETGGYKKDASLSLDADGQLKLKPSTVQAKVDTSTDLRVYQALNRRGLAYDQSNLLPYSCHLKWVDTLFAALQRKVPDGFQSISLQQVLNADKELWRKMADETRSGIVPITTGNFPRQVALEKWSTHSDVLFFLLPMPGSSSSSTNYNKDRSSEYQERRYNPKGSPKGKGKGKGKDFGKNKHNRIPPFLPEGCAIKTAKGQQVCFGYNSERGCTFAQPGKRCTRGFHLCAKINCGGAHSATACPKASN